MMADTAIAADGQFRGGRHAGVTADVVLLRTARTNFWQGGGKKKNLASVPPRQITCQDSTPSTPWIERQE